MFFLPNFLMEEIISFRKSSLTLCAIFWIFLIKTNGGIRGRKLWNSLVNLKTNYFWNKEAEKACFFLHFGWVKFMKNLIKFEYFLIFFTKTALKHQNSRFFKRNIVGNALKREYGHIFNFWKKIVLKYQNFGFLSVIL